MTKPSVCELHKTYCEATGIHMTLTMAKIFAWDKWISHGWTKADLLLGLALLKRKIKERKKWDTCTNFYHVVQDTENWDEVISEARAMARIPRTNPGKASVLRATHRPSDPPSSPARTPEQIMRGDKELRKLLKLRDDL